MNPIESTEAMILILFRESIIGPAKKDDIATDEVVKMNIKDIYSGELKVSFTQRTIAIFNKEDPN